MWFWKWWMNPRRSIRQSQVVWLWFWCCHHFRWNSQVNYFMVSPWKKHPGFSPLRNHVFIVTLASRISVTSTVNINHFFMRFIRVYVKLPEAMLLFLQRQFPSHPQSSREHRLRTARTTVRTTMPRILCFWLFGSRTAVDYWTILDISYNSKQQKRSKFCFLLGCC